MDQESRGPVPAGAVQNHDGVLVWAEPFGEAVEKDLHRSRADLGKNESEGGLAIGPGRAEQIRKGEAPVLASRRTLAPQPPAMAQPTFLADPHLVLEIKDDTLVRMGRGGRVQRVAEPLFWNPAWRSGDIFGCCGRAFWRE